MNFNKVYMISNVTEFGKFVAYLINKDINCFRLYWDEREKGRRCYCIDWKNKTCTFADLDFWIEKDYCIAVPIFETDDYGNWRVLREENYKNFEERESERWLHEETIRALYDNGIL